VVAVETAGKAAHETQQDKVHPEPVVEAGTDDAPLGTR
jgi:hypothetical protein